MLGSVRVGLCAALFATVLASPASAQQARYAEGGYGGGLIEYLVTGGVAAGGRAGPRPTAAARSYGAAQQVEAYSGDLIPAEPGPAYASGAIQADPGRIAREVSPVYRRQEVAYPGPQRPGTIVIDTAGKHLYLVQTGNRALRYGIGVGRPGFAWSGLKTVSRKAEWPDWTPPAEMLARRPDLPRHMAGGPENPLGARALYLGSSLYRIHGTNEPGTIGQSVSSGCIRMMNDDVIDLYERVPVGTRVEVL
jgi:lipoprotein-anchoring transpeptidase ErfK/SrfK